MSREILRPTCLNPIPNTFCPGCLHSMANKLVGQCIDELGLAKKTHCRHVCRLLDHGPAFLAYGHGELCPRQGPGCRNRHQTHAA